SARDAHGAAVGIAVRAIVSARRPCDDCTRRDHGPRRPGPRCPQRVRGAVGHAAECVTGVLEFVVVLATSLEDRGLIRTPVSGRRPGGGVGGLCLALEPPNPVAPAETMCRPV